MDRAYADTVRLLLEVAPLALQGVQFALKGGTAINLFVCFVVYLAGHGRPVHEVLFSNDRDLSTMFRGTFAGMTSDPVELETLLEARRRIRTEVPAALSAKQRDFLVGLARATPDWSLLACPHASELPALRWKLANLEIFRARRPEQFRRQADELEARLREAR